MKTGLEGFTGFVSQDALHREMALEADGWYQMRQEADKRLRLLAKEGHCSLPEALRRWQQARGI